jgi:peroxiredoxin Q/BCP
VTPVPPLGGIDPDHEPLGRRPGDGDPAPAFTLAGTGRRTYTLADALGAPLVLVFYPADGSPVCTQQLRSYSEDLQRFEELGAAVWCLSPQDVGTHELFASEHGLRLPLLADTASRVGRAYDILGPLGFYRRSVFVVDAAGVIRFARRSLSSMTFLPADRLVAAVRSTVG